MANAQEGDGRFGCDNSLGFLSLDTRSCLEMTSPLRDPVITRNRFEGLLEGAIQLYSDPPAKEEAHKHSITLPGVIRPPVENRGKSAAAVVR